MKITLDDIFSLYKLNKLINRLGNIKDAIVFFVYTFPNYLEEIEKGNVLPAPPFPFYPELHPDDKEAYLRDYRKYILGAKDNFNNAQQLGSPLIIVLDGDGVETTGIENGVYFDLDNNGFAEMTGWIVKNDGFLVRDLNGNGVIDSGAEMFGNNTLLKNGQYAANGFEALKDLDSNGDSVLDAQDEAFGELRVWRDLNGDGGTDEGEMMTLEEAGIANIVLNYKQQKVTDAEGNQHLQTGSWTDADGNVHKIDDVWFNVDKSFTIEKDLVEVSDEIAALPEVFGLGNMHSLQQAMAMDTSGELKSLVESWMNTTDLVKRTSILNDIIYCWIGVQNVAPNSRGGYFDGRKLGGVGSFLWTNL